MQPFRRGIFAFFLLVVLEGAIRKWILPGQQQLVYLLKDVLIIGLSLVYVSRFGFRMPPGLATRPIALLLGLYVLWTVVGLWSQALPTLLLGLWGIKAHLLYMALLFLMPVAFRSVEDLFRWVHRYACVAIPVLLLGVLQFFSPPDSIINKYAADDGISQISTFGVSNFARVTGTFPYITGMGTYTFAVLLLGVSLLLARRFDRRALPLIAVVVLGVAISFMTGSRWSVYIWAVMLPVIGFELLRSRLVRANSLLKFMMVFALAGVMMSQFAGVALEAFLYRAETAGDDDARIDAVFGQPLLFMNHAMVFGFGPGSTHQAATALVPSAAAYSWLPPLAFEDEPGRLVLELGFVGFLIVVQVKVALCVLAHQTIRHARTRREMALALAALGFFVAHLTTPIVFNATAGALYWGFAGALVILLNDQYMSAKQQWEAQKATAHP